VTDADDGTGVATDVLAWLASPGGRLVLAEAATVAATTDAVAAPAVLRRRHPDLDPRLVTAALGQVDLRARATVRFGDDAAAMVFTRDGLEQATRRTVADHRAASLRARSGGDVRSGGNVRTGGDVRSVADLCCGLGGDLVALARAGYAVTGVDRDPVAVAAARANLAALGLAGSVRTADVTAIDLGSFDAVVADPARRSGRGRERDPAAFSPDWDWVRTVLTAPGRRAVVTTTPALPHRMVPAGCEAEWVGDGGEVVEAALWSGALAANVRRRATLLPGGLDSTGRAPLTVTDVELPAQAPPIRDPRPGDLLVEPHGAVARAGLVGVVADRLSGSLPASGIAYVLADEPSTAALASVDGLGTAFSVEEVLPMRDRPLRSRLAQLGVGRLEILKRGVDVRPEALRLRLIGARPAGTAPATLVLTRTATGAAALLVSRRPVPVPVRVPVRGREP